MSSSKLVPVILAGGVGSRLWPLSREHYPKQFITLLGDDSLLQATLRRVLQYKGIQKFIVICNEAHRFEVLQQIEQIKPECDFTILLEPEGRNTAAAAALAANYLAPDEMIFLLPADHILNPVEKLLEVISASEVIARQNKLVTFGVVPTGPETGYGYIRAGKKIVDDVYEIDRFVEKPCLSDAERYAKSNNYFWNSGMFLFSAELYLAELNQHTPDIFVAVSAAMRSVEKDGCFLRFDRHEFMKCPNISIDYAVMENTSNAVVMPLQLDWSDIGSWQALYFYEKKDPQGNVIVGDVISYENENCYFRSSSRLIAGIGLKNILVVETPDSILVADQNESQKVKQIVNQLQTEGRVEATRHIVEYHPWGTTTLLNSTENFKIHRVDVAPQQKLSLHVHQYRNEHWIVLSGEATVIIEKSEKCYSKDQSFIIPSGKIHSIENRIHQPLTLVEVQSGENLAFDDVIRY